MGEIPHHLKQTMKNLTFFVAGLAVLGAVALVPIQKSKSTGPVSKPSATTNISPEQAKKLEEAKAAREAYLAKAAAEREARGEWIYSDFTDDATGKRAKTAKLTSKNSMNFGFPYSGIQYGRFTVRNHPRHGVDAYLSIDQGQLLCDNYSNTTVLVRFDNGAATRYACSGPADHSSETVFIRNVGGLEAGMKTAKKMYVTISVYQEGQRTWEFNVKGYDRSKV